jgi:hypothetical protein
MERFKFLKDYVKDCYILFDIFYLLYTLHMLFLAYFIFLVIVFFYAAIVGKRGIPMQENNRINPKPIPSIVLTQGNTIKPSIPRKYHQSQLAKQISSTATTHADTVSRKPKLHTPL